MPKKARITRIQTGSERSAGQSGAPFSETSDEHNDGRIAAARRNAEYEKGRASRQAENQRKADELSARLEAEAQARGDKVYGPGAPDGMSPRRFWRR